MMYSIVNNIELSKRIYNFIDENENYLQFIYEAIGTPSLNKALMKVPMIGDSTLYEAIMLGYINDEIEFAELLGESEVDVNAGCNRITCKNGAMTGEQIFDALKLEVHIRANLRAYAPEFASGFANLILDNRDLLEQQGFFKATSEDAEIMASIDSFMADAFNEKSIAIQSLYYDDGKKHGEAMLQLCRELALDDDEAN